MNVYRVRSYNEKKELSDRLNKGYGEILNKERNIVQEIKRTNLLRGYSYTASSCVDFPVPDAGNANWREELACPLTGLNNRLRAAIHLLEFEFSPDWDSTIYISEQVTPLFKFLKSKFPYLIGSEYLGESVQLGSSNDNGIRHEDLTRLSFEDDTLDFILSFEVFEHIPDPAKAFKSCYNKLKKKGVLFWSVPFLLNEEKNVTRAKLGLNGKIIHLHEPEYHGNPVNEEGSLCFTQFGWEMLDQIRSCGFSDAYAILYWSKEFAYLGGHQTLFCAIK